MVFDNNYIYTMYKEIEKTLWLMKGEIFTWKRGNTKNGITKWVMDQAILQEMLYMHF